MLIAICDPYILCLSHSQIWEFVTGLKNIFMFLLKSAYIVPRNLDPWPSFPLQSWKNTYINKDTVVFHFTFFAKYQIYFIYFENAISKSKGLNKVFFDNLEIAYFMEKPNAYIILWSSSLVTTNAIRIYKGLSRAWLPDPSDHFPRALFLL